MNNNQKYYDFTEIYGDEVENLLVKLKQLLLTQLNENNLPNNTKIEIEKLNQQIEKNESNIINLLQTDEKVQKMFDLLNVEIDNSGEMNIIIDGGTY